MTSPPYAIPWDSTGTSDGSHTLSAIARDTSGNEATSSIGVIVANGTTSAVSLIQNNSRTTTGSSSLSAGFPSRVTAGNLVVVSVSGWPTPSTLTVTDSLGNSYAAAGARQGGAGDIFCSLYYARNVTGGTNTVTIRANTSCQLSMTVAEFAGVDTVSPLDATSGASGTGAAPSSGNMAPSMSGCLVIGAGTHNVDTVTSAGPGFTMVTVATEDADNHQPLAKEYRVLSNTNPVAATFSLAASREWVQMGAIFKPAGEASPDNTAPSVPGGLTATVISASQINLTWNPSIDNVGVAGYRVYRDGVPVTTTAATSYPDTGLTASTTYVYTVAAYDAEDNASAQSSPVTETTEENTETSDFSISISPSSQTVRAGRYARYTITLAAIDGYNFPVSLSVSGLPRYTRYSFSRNPLTPTTDRASTTLTIYTSRWQRGTYTLTVTGTGTDDTAHSATATLITR